MVSFRQAQQVTLRKIDNLRDSTRITRQVKQSIIKTNGQ